MPATPSSMIPLGTMAPDFQLPDTISGKEISLLELSGSCATVVMFICNHCPYVKHVNNELIQLSKDYGYRGVNFVAISSNDREQFPEDGPDAMRKVAHELAYPFPYLFDETQAVAKAFGAACTPDFFVFDRALRLTYRGQLDDSRPGNDIPVTGSDIRQALEAMLQGLPVSENQKPGIGCSIKWKKDKVRLNL